jgi:hypothetical protein
LSPLIVYQLLMPQVIESTLSNDPVNAQVGILLIGSLAVLVLTLILQPIGTAAILHVISQEFVNKRVGFGRALGFAFGRFGSLIWASILVGFMVLIGLILCVIPGIMFMVWYIFVAQVVVVEGLRGGRALQRSKDLTSGYRWRVFGLVILFVVINVLLQSAAGLMESVLPSYDTVPVEAPPGLDLGDGVNLGHRAVLNYPHYAVNHIVKELVDILVQTFGAVCFTLFYFDLRIRKEGFDLELAAQEQLSPEPL